MPFGEGVATLGDLMVIGGAEDKLGRKTVLREFVARAGGTRARIAVVPTASSLGEEIVEVYDALFRRLGAADVVAASPQTREQAASADHVRTLTEATGIFMTGGNQLKLSSVVAGTPFGAAIHEARARGAVVAGTSAGASIQASHMIAFGPGGTTPKQRMTQVAAGLGLLDGCVIDQHFAQRNRYGRLLMIVSQSPQLLGMGIDEDTCALVTRVEEHDLLTVLGRGSVTIFDPAEMVSNAYEARVNQPVLASGVRLHVLPAGHSFDLTTRELISDSRLQDPDEAHELAAANRDLRKLARDIAAGDISPSVLRRRLARRSKSASPRK